MLGLVRVERHTIAPVVGLTTASMASAALAVFSAKPFSLVAVKPYWAWASHFQLLPSRSKLPLPPTRKRVVSRVPLKESGGRSPQKVPMVKLVTPRAAACVFTVAGRKGLLAERV